MAEGELQSIGGGGNRRRTSLRQSRSVDNACIFEMEGLDFEGDSTTATKSLHLSEEEEDEDEDDGDERKHVGDDDEDDDEDDQDDDDDGDDEQTINDKIDSNSKCIKQFATSLPIQVPLWKTSSLNQETAADDDDNEQNITCDEDPMKIAESFRALAWSVKDGTEMFGALPRRRLNTGDLVKSRPI